MDENYSDLILENQVDFRRSSRFQEVEKVPGSRVDSRRFVVQR